MTNVSTSPASVPSVTEREAVLREQKAFIEGAKVGRASRSECYDDPCPKCIAQAKARYPLPTITRPRVVPDPEHPDTWHWRFVDGGFEWATLWDGGNHWTRQPLGSVVVVEEHVTRVTPKRILAWADLIAHPTETVEDEAPSLDHPHERLGDER